MPGAVTAAPSLKFLISQMDYPAQARSDARASLGSLMDRLVAAHRATGVGLPRQAFDARWLSPCQVDDVDAAGDIRWQPVSRQEPADFSGLESAMELVLHQDIKTFYGSFWSDSFPAQAADGELTLIQAWNAEDFDRLLANVIGHLVEQRRNRIAPTVFIACTDEDDLVLSIDNASGRVVLEEPGDEPKRDIAGTLAELLDRLEPIV